MWPMVTDRKVTRDKPPIIIKDHIHKQISVLGEGNFKIFHWSQEIKSKQYHY